MEIDEGWGYVDPEVVSENVPEITDELKGLREADMNVGQTLSDSLEFGDVLTITLHASDDPAVELKLYAAPGAVINTKVDGKAVGFTPADSDVPSMNLYVYNLADAAGRSHEIVLTSIDTVSFKLTAAAKQEEVPAEEEQPAEEDQPAPFGGDALNDDLTNNVEFPAEIPADEENQETASEEEEQPSSQVSVKTYDPLKVGSQISDTLVAGQKANILVKCGKNLNVTLTLTADPDDVNVTIDGTEAAFTAAGDGTYTCELLNVAFRKFTVLIAAKQDMAFTISSAANKNAEETVEETDNETEEENAEEPAEESGEEAVEATDEDNPEGTKESEEQIPEEVTEETPETNEEEVPEEVTEEPAEEQETEPSEQPEETEIPEEAEGETAEGEENNTEETDNIPEEEAADPLTDEQMLEMGYIKVQVTPISGCDVFAAINDQEPVDHLEAGTEIWITPTEEEEWAEICNLDEKMPKYYIRWTDLAIMLQTEPDTEEEQPNRMILVKTLGDITGFANLGEETGVQAELINFSDNDVCGFQWFYSSNGGESWEVIENANDDAYYYTMTIDNWYYRWKVIVTIDNAEQE